MTATEARMARHCNAQRPRTLIAELSLVRKVASRFGLHKDEDALQEGAMALVKASHRFDPSKGASPQSFAWSCIANAMRDELARRKSRRRWIPVGGMDVELLPAS